jgi:hypothetical protein
MSKTTDPIEEFGIALDAFLAFAQYSGPDIPAPRTRSRKAAASKRTLAPSPAMTDALVNLTGCSELPVESRGAIQEFASSFRSSRMS